MIPANIIHRVFRIGHLDRTGTAFLVDVDERQYLVTAKHVVESFAGTGSIDVFGNGAWQSTEVSLVGHAAGEVDISVLAAIGPMCPQDLPITASSEGLTYGQDVFFLGFPYGVITSVVFTANGYPLPLVKRGLMSGFAGPAYLLDGHNNPGFSGAPVVFDPRGGAKLTNIAGVIADHQVELEPVFKGEEDTGLKHETNTGIISCYKIEEAVSLIRQNPIGARLR